MIQPTAGLDFKALKAAPKGESAFPRSNAAAAPAAPSSVPSRKSSLDFSAPAPKAQDNTSVNAYSDRPAQNSSGFSQGSDFKTVLKGRVETQIEKPEVENKETPEVEDADGKTLLTGESESNDMSALEPTLLAAPKIQGQTSQQMGFMAESLNHRLAWSNFMHKMKEKFGVSANHILTAFKSLSVEELKQPPEMNIAKLVSQLGLNDQQAALAHQYFKELIQRTDTKSLGEELKAGPDQAMLAMASQKEMAETQSQQALAQMNQKFFMKTPPATPQAQAAAAAQMQGKGQIPGQKAMQTKPGAEWLKAASGAPPLLNEDGTPVEKAQPDDQGDDRMRAMAATPTAGAFEIPPEMTPVTAGERAPIPAMPAKATAKTAARAADAQAPAMPVAPESPAEMAMPKMKAIPTAFQPAAPAVNQSSTAMATPSIMPIPVAPKPIFNGGPDQNRDDGDEQGGPQGADGAEGDTSAVNGNTPFFMNHESKETGATKLAHAAPIAMPVNDLVQQAHVMVKDGGGEMRVVLSPDGLGEVVMKVTVNGDKVNVQAITQSDEAKRVLESGFKSLKDGLNLHHLNLEGIKVDTASSLGKQLDQQYQDAQKQQARQFLENFHQGSQNRRSAFFDIPGAEVYRSQPKSRSDLNSGSSSRSQSTASRRLDLVA